MGGLWTTGEKTPCFSRGYFKDDKEYQIMKLVKENRELKRLLKEYEVAFEKINERFDFLMKQLEDIKKEDDGK